jgi:hypothetical protein
MEDMSKFHIPPVPTNLAMRYTQRPSNRSHMEDVLAPLRDSEPCCQPSVYQLRPSYQESSASRLTVATTDSSNIVGHQDYRLYRMPRSTSALGHTITDEPCGSRLLRPGHILSRPNSMVSLSTQFSSESQHSQRSTKRDHFGAKGHVDSIRRRSMKLTEYAQSSPFLLTREEERHNDSNAAIPVWLDLPQKPRKLVKSPRNRVQF